MAQEQAILLTGRWIQDQERHAVIAPQLDEQRNREICSYRCPVPTSSDGFISYPS